MLAYGSLVVGGGDRKSFLKSLRANVISLFHLKRLYSKYQIPFEMKLLPSSFRILARKSQSESLLKKLTLLVMPTPIVTPITSPPKLKFMTLFLDKEGRSSLITSRFNLLLTKDTVILLLGRSIVLSTNDKYFYDLVFQSEKLISVELTKISDQKFVKELTPFLLSKNETIS
jgi:hypothetical protein